MKHSLFGIFFIALVSACAGNSGTLPPGTRPSLALQGIARTSYDGCAVFTSGPYGQVIATAAPDANSAEVLGGLANAGGSAGIYGAEGGRWEPINIANAGSTPSPQATISGQNAFGLTGTTKIPWDFATFSVEDWPDLHSVVLDVKTCHEWETWHTKPIQSGNTVQTGGGYFWDLTLSYDQAYPGHYQPDLRHTADASDLPFFAGLVRWNGEMDQSPPLIPHALNFSYPAGQGVSQYGYVYPADAPTTIACTVANSGSPPSPCPSTAHVMHYGDHFRLKSSVQCPSPSVGLGQPNALCQAMKTYGIIFARKGNGFKLIFASADNTKNNPYQYTDLTTFLAGIKLDAAHFDLLTEPQLQCAGSPCPP